MNPSEKTLPHQPILDTATPHSPKAYPPMVNAALIKCFLKEHGWAHATQSVLPQDCSSRYYIRLQQENARCLLMVDPQWPSQIPSFVTIAQLLRTHGFCAPEVFASDGAHLALIEDFGDLTFSRCLSNGSSLEEYYHLAINILIKLRLAFTEPVPNIVSFDDILYRRELSLFADWYYPSIAGPIDQSAFQELCQMIIHLIDQSTRSLPKTLTLRDFHIDNMMIKGSEFIVQNCALLDFQDALNGSVVYDLTSLLQDSRSPITNHTIHQMLSAYYQKLSLKPETIEEEQFAYHAVGLQRNIKNLGIFARMFHKQSKDRYLKYIPRLWENINQNLQHPQLKEVQKWFEQYCPATLQHKAIFSLSLNKKAD